MSVICSYFAGRFMGLGVVYPPFTVFNKNPLLNISPPRIVCISHSALSLSPPPPYFFFSCLPFFVHFSYFLPCSRPSCSTLNHHIVHVFRFSSFVSWNGCHCAASDDLLIAFQCARRRMRIRSHRIFSLI